MGKKLVCKSVKGKINQSDIEENVVSIMESLLSQLKLDSISFKRLAAKFIESNCEKVDRLVELHMNYSLKIENSLKHEEEEDEEEEDEDYVAPEVRKYLKKLEYGLYTLQRIDLALATLAVFHSDIKSRAVLKLKEQGLFISFFICFSF